jgi:prevent-host-death family protein
MATTVSIKTAKDRLTALARLVEQGETVVVTRNGKPILDLVPHRHQGGLRLQGVEDFKRKYGLDVIFGLLPEDFDEPLAEDFLLKALP